MSYRENWLRHLMAAFAGEGLSQELARDFWSAKEDLFSAEVRISWHWLKLVWVYAASVFAQVTVLAFLTGLIISIFRPTTLSWVFVVVGAATTFMLVLGTVFATWTYLSIQREVRRADRPKT